jgi:hypothetical protein
LGHQLSTVGSAEEEGDSEFSSLAEVHDSIAQLIHESTTTATAS